MSKKSKSQKALSAGEMVGILSDSVRNLKNGTADIKEATAIAVSVRTICQVVNTQMKVAKFAKETNTQPALR